MCDAQEKASSLHIPQKQILFYRRKLLDENRKLFLDDDLINKWKLFQQYQLTIFDQFPTMDLFTKCSTMCSSKIHSEETRILFFLPFVGRTSEWITISH